MENSIQDRIAALFQEAAQAGDEELLSTIQALQLENTLELRDSDTGELLSEAELDCTLTDYVEALYLSLRSEQSEGHVRVNGRRVYAQ